MAVVLLFPPLLALLAAILDLSVTSTSILPFGACYVIMHKVYCPFNLMEDRVKRTLRAKQLIVSTLDVLLLFLSILPYIFCKGKFGVLQLIRKIVILNVPVRSNYYLSGKTWIER